MIYSLCGTKVNRYIRFQQLWRENWILVIWIVKWKRNICMFPTHITEAVNNAVLNLLPEKSRKLCDGFYRNSKNGIWKMDWGEVREEVLLAYFFEELKRLKPSSLSHSIVHRTRRQMQNAVVYLSCRRWAVFFFNNVSIGVWCFKVDSNVFNVVINASQRDTILNFNFLFWEVINIGTL